MIKLAVAGAAGKMGRTILSLALKDSEFQIAGALEQAGSPDLKSDAGTFLGSKPLGVLITDDAAHALKNANVLIDFTHPSAAEAHLKTALHHNVGYVLGTTGLTDGILKKLREASETIPIVQSPNMSVGVNLLFKLAEVTAKVLGEDYDIEIVEAHHRMKRDSPSGTAVKLAEILAKARDLITPKHIVHGREGEVGARPKAQIGTFAVRGGDVVGDHTVFFLGDGERIELTHRATSREAFAQGALRAAKFVAKHKKGLYTMQQVLEIT